ncbi:PREDICTED: lipid phosphate phosphatase-related protein type 5 [Calidris pugnax]|uniref:lipid phosphate phosphatase-related protein type 5 n=1 Tax=Calidris pugnax TaxID=198806 RepID=UPI00071D0117|nr:PREDICTED: lipid phosphate phosphatase-related protein type 5 [Calidris pugnax]
MRTTACSSTEIQQLLPCVSTAMKVNMISNRRHQSQRTYTNSPCFVLVEIIVGETAVFCLQLATKDFENQEKTILTGDCCYINPLVRRTIRFLGIYAFGLFATDIFVNAGQVVTGNLAPHFLALCKPNYTALGCKQYTQFISSVHACTGNPDLIMKARKTFPSKEAALSVYAAMYLAMYITNTVKARGTRLAKPVLCLGLMCLAFLTGINRVAEYRNHWSDVIAGFIIGISIAVFLVVCVVNNFRGRQPEHEHSHMENLAQMPMISIPRVESPLEKKQSKGSREVCELLRPATGIPNDCSVMELRISSTV